MKRCCRKRKRVEPDPALITGNQRVFIPRLPLSKPLATLIQGQSQRKIEEKKILGESAQIAREGFTRKMVAHRHTKGGNLYGIQVNNEERLNLKPGHTIEVAQHPKLKVDSKEEFFDSIRNFSPVKGIPENRFELDEADQKREILGNPQTGGSRENSPAQSVINKPISMFNESPNNNLNKPELNIFRDLTEKQEDSNASMSKISSIEAKSKKHLDNSHSKNESPRLEIRLMQTRQADEIKKKHKSSSVIKHKTRVTGYRTLNYVDLFSTYSQTSKLKDEKGGSSKIIDASNNVMKMMLSDKNLKHSRSNSGSQMSINLGHENDGINELNRNDLSCIDISILGNNRTNESSISKSTKMLSRMGIEHKRQNSSKIHHNESLMPEDDEVRLNKDLNTTYIRSSELVNPKKSYKDAGIVVTGKRTKINQYVLLSSIGKGGWGEVFLAVDVDSTDKQRYVEFFNEGHEGDRQKRTQIETFQQPYQRICQNRNRHSEELGPSEHRQDV